MQRPVTLEEVTSAIRAFKAQVESSSQRPQQRKVVHAGRVMHNSAHISVHI